MEAGNIPNIGEALAKEVTRVVQNRLKERIETEARNWMMDTGIRVIASSIPSGGIGGPAAMGTSLVEFVHRVHRTVEPIVKMGEEARDVAEDLGFSTSCGWSDWHKY